MIIFTIILIILTRFVHIVFIIIILLIYNIILCINISIWKSNNIFPIIFFLIIIIFYFTSQVKSLKFLLFVKWQKFNSDEKIY